MWSLRNIRFRLPLLLLAVGALLTNPQLEALELSAEKRPVIVVASDDAPASRFAAEELATYLGRILNSEIEISEEPLPDRVPIYLGYHRENLPLKPETLEEEESLVVIHAESIHITGGRSETKMIEQPEIPQHDRGTLYGVYEFLEELGVRWYRPEPWGEHVPRLEKVTLSEGERRAKPAYRYRYGINHYQTYNIREFSNVTDEESKLWDQQTLMARLWARRNRLNTNSHTHPKMGGFYRVNFAHAYAALVPHEKWFPTHPEYFALVNGQRSSNPYAQLCLSNPNVEQLVFDGVLKVFERVPELEIASLDPNDLAIWCECDGCRAMDDPELKAQHPSRMPEKIKGISMSNRVTAFNNRIARRLSAVLPDKKLGWYAYLTHTEPPTKVEKLEPNLAVMPTAFAGSFSDYSRGLYDKASPQNARFLKVLQGWHAMSKANGSRLFVHDYWSYYIWPGPLPVLSSMADKLKAYRRDFDVIGVYNEVHPCWGPQGMSVYFYPWLLRQPEGDLEKEKQYYYTSYFGPAAKPMERYHEHLEASAWSGPYFGSGGSGIEALFTNELLEELHPFIEEAQKLTQEDAVYRQRVHGVVAGYRYARKVRDFFNAVETFQPKKAKEILAQLEALFLEEKDGSVFDNLSYWRGDRKKLLDRYRKHVEKDGILPTEFEHPTVLQRHNRDWRFAPDPGNHGEEQGWNTMEAKDSDWPLLVAGQPWQHQGFGNHVGAGWYRKAIKIPVIRRNHRLILYFGAVDGNATIYLDGEKIGEHLLDPESYAGYDEAFYFDITDFVTAGKEAHVVVQVEKNLGVGGLTAPVYLVEVASLRPPE